MKMIHLAGTANMSNIVTEMETKIKIPIHKHHTLKNILIPNTQFITSYGIIAFRRNRVGCQDGLFLKDEKPRCIECLHAHRNLPFVDLRHYLSRYSLFLIQRKQTNAYIDLIRGSYNSISIMLIPVLVSELTCEEKTRLKTMHFEQLWKSLWLFPCKKNSIFSADFSKSKNIFYQNYRLLLSYIYMNTVHNIFSEFGFPKGRKDRNETNLRCAVREFCEESGYKSHELRVLDENVFVQEEFVGSDNQPYRHVYYFAEIQSVKSINFNRYDVKQGGEIRNLGWFPLSHIPQMFRNYDKTKCQVMEEAVLKLASLGVDLTERACVP